MLRVLIALIFAFGLCQCVAPAPRKSMAKKKKNIVKEEPVLEEISDEDLMADAAEETPPAVKTPDVKAPVAKTVAEKAVDQAAADAEAVMEAKPVTEMPKLRTPKAVPCPADLKKMKSPAAKSADSKIRFKNETDDMVDVVWFGFDGTQKKYKTLSPDEEYDQASFVGHMWMLSSSTGQCLGVYPVSTKLTRAVVRSN